MLDNSVLSLLRLPGRMDSAATAARIGCSVHDIPVLVKHHVLRPLGGRDLSPNSVKYFASVEVERICADPQILNQLTAVLQKHWKNKNARRSRNQVEVAA